MKYISIGLALAVALLLAAGALYFFSGKDSGIDLKNHISSNEETQKDEIEKEGTGDTRQNTETPTLMKFEKNPVATISTTMGDIQIELFGIQSPVTVSNFVFLAEKGFFDGTQFHRVISGFMIQGGDPNTKTKDTATYGRGGPGYSIPDEFVAGLSNLRGTISMANSGPNSGGSQFFVNVADNTNLDFDKPPASSKHAVFGGVIKGMDVVDAISEVATGQNDLPTEPLIVKSVTVER